MFSGMTGGAAVESRPATGRTSSDRRCSSAAEQGSHKPRVGGSIPPTATNFRTVGLELVTEREERQIEDPAQTPPQPAVVDRPREVQILLEDRDELGREAAVQEHDVQLVVERKRTIVQVGAPDADPTLIDHERLGMQERRSVFVDL